MKYKNLSDDIILKNQLLIYNNQARFGNINGGLTVSYEFFPAPAIFWDFEVFKREEAALDLKPGTSTGELAHPFEGHQILIPEPWSGIPRETDIPRRSIGITRTGSAPKVFVGNTDLLGKSFRFWLPNAKFQALNILKNFIAKDISRRSPNDPQGYVVGFSSTTREGFVQAIIAGNINLTLHTPEEAMSWLQSHRSTGTYLTTFGEIELSNKTSIYEVVNLLENIADLLSFANGGFIAPLIVEMTPRDLKKDYPSHYSAYTVD